jgi:putative Holliday junction resolvase
MRSDFLEAMNLLGIDYGEKRIGLALADELGVAVPIDAAIERKKKDRLEHIAREVEQRQVGALVVGYPVNMDGSIGFKAKEVDAFIAELERRFDLPVFRVDERLSTERAESGSRGTRKRAKQGDYRERRSGELDSRAAALILRDFLEESIPKKDLSEPSSE